MPVLSAYPLVKTPTPHRLLRYDDRPEDVVKFVKGLSVPKEKWEGVPIDRVLDREIVEKAKRGRK